MELNSYFHKIVSPFSKIEEINIMDKNITKAHNIGEKEARQSYSNTFNPYIENKKSLNIALDVKGKSLNTFEFANLFNENISFFIAGAYGFEKQFLSLCDKTISLSNLTFSHKLAKTILYEQIYRALCIKNNHPYHK